MPKIVMIPGQKLRPLAIFMILGVMGALILSVFWQGSAVVISNLNQKHIVIVDAGHGGYDPGAITKQGVYEKEITLQMSKKVKEYLQPAGIEVILTREEDIDYVPQGVRGKTTKKQTDLNYRIQMAAEAKADIFVSLHVNSIAGGNRSGAETFYYTNSEVGKKLAECIQAELVKIPGMNRRIAKPGDYYIIKNSNMPAVIVELGYLSHSAEGKKLQQPWYQDQLARAISKGIASYFGLP